MTPYSLMLAIALFATHTFAQVAPSASDMTFVTEFTNFACKSFRDQANAPAEIEKLQVKFTKLGIAKNTRRAVIDIESEDGQCFYSADYSRQKGEKQLRFQASYITNSALCQDLKVELDKVMAPGFKYAIKFNAYISMLFLAELSSECEDIGGNALIEYQWKL